MGVILSGKHAKPTLSTKLRQLSLWALINMMNCNYQERFRKLNDLIKKLNAKRCLKYILKTFKKANDVSALRYAIIKLKSEKV